MPAASGRRLAGKEGQEQPRFSPDGKWLAYTSNRSGSDEIYVSAFPNGLTYRLSRSGGREPHWRGDGAELFFLALDRFILSVGRVERIRCWRRRCRSFALPSRRGSEGPLFDVTRDGQRFIVIAGESLRVRTASISFSTGRV